MIKAKTKITSKPKKVEEVKTPETPEAVVAVNEARVKFKAYMEDMRINSPIEFSDRKAELEKKLNQL